MGLYDTKGRKVVLGLFLLMAVWNALNAQFMLATFAGGVIGAFIWSAILIFVWSKLTGSSSDDTEPPAEATEAQTG